MELKQNGIVGSKIVLADLAGVENTMICSIDKIIQLDYVYNNESEKYSPVKRSNMNEVLSIDIKAYTDFMNDRTKNGIRNLTDQNNHFAYRAFNVDVQFLELIENVNDVLSYPQPQKNNVPDIQFDTRNIAQITASNIRQYFNNPQEYRTKIRDPIKIYIRNNQLPYKFIDKYNLHTENVMCNENIITTIETKFVRLISAVSHTLKFIEYFNHMNTNKVVDKLVLRNAAPDDFNKKLHAIALQDYPYDASTQPDGYKPDNLDLIFPEGIIAIYFRDILDQHVLNKLLSPQNVQYPQYQTIIQNKRNTK